jgi:glucose-6-phosphate isomerase
VNFLKAIDLKKASGLPIKLIENKLVFGKGMEKIEPDIRTREQMLPVLKNPDFASPKEFYYMYRDVKLKKDEKKLMENNVRYDITVLPPFLIGDEFNKTFGHFHPKVPGTETWYPEVYEVLHGTAHYLLQKENEMVVFDARPGDKCIMLPGYGHITVNPSKETLVMANLVCPEFKSDYEPIKMLKGGAYYETINGFVKNKNYSKDVLIKIIEPKQFHDFGITKKPLYKEFSSDPKNFLWLSKPQQFIQKFAEYNKK